MNGSFLWLSSYSRSRLAVLHLSTESGEVRGAEEEFVPYTHQKLKPEPQIVLKGLWLSQNKSGIEFSTVPTFYITKVGFYCCVLLGVFLSLDFFIKVDPLFFFSDTYTRFTQICKYNHTLFFHHLFILFFFPWLPPPSPSTHDGMASPQTTYTSLTPHGHTWKDMKGKEAC